MFEAALRHAAAIGHRYTQVEVAPAWVPSDGGEMAQVPGPRQGKGQGGCVRTQS